MRSPGLSSTFNAIVASSRNSPSPNQADPTIENENGGAQAPPFPLLRVGSGLAEQAQHVPVRLGGKRQGGRRELLAGLQREQVGAFLVGVGERQTVGSGLQRVDHR